MEKKSVRAYYSGDAKPGETQPLVSVDYQQALAEYEADLKTHNYRSVLDVFL